MANRILTDTATISWDEATAQQVKANVVDGSVVTDKLGTNAATNAKLAQMAQATIKGRQAGAGTGDAEDLTPVQARTAIGLAATSTDNAVARFDGTTGGTQNSGVTIDDSNNLAGIVNATQTGYHDLAEIAAPASPSANVARFYAFDDGGVTRLAFKDSNGDITVLGTSGSKTRLYEAERTTFIPQALDDTHVSGTSLKYSEWWQTEYAVHRWTKPTTPTFESLIITAVSGGGGGGSSAATSGADTTGGGGDGGAWHRYEMPAVDVPDELVMLVGHGGDAGGWASPVHADGIHSTTAADGSDGGVTAVFDSADWDALGANDAARQAAFLALSEANREATALIYCQEGYGGRDHDGVDEATAPGETRGRLNPYGPQAFGPGDSRMGSSGAGNGAGTDDPTDGFGGGNGFGGSAGGIGQNDYIFKNMAYGAAGIVGRLCGDGGRGKGPVGQHEGGHGGWYGGGGGGGQKASVVSTAVYNGGFGAPGVVELVEQYA